MATHPLPVLSVPVQIPHIARILVPVDFSEVSTSAVHRAIDVAKIYHASVVLAHVMNHRPAQTLHSLNPQDIPTPELELQEDLELLRHLALDQGVPCTTVFREGAILENICDIVAHESIDLVVLATHGGRRKYGFFLGSTAEQLVRTITVPVLTMGASHKPPNWDEKGPRHILFATNFDTSNLAGLSFALGMRESSGAQVSVAEVAPLGIWPDIHSIIRKRISSIVPPGTDVHLPIGPLGSTVCELATRIDAGLIILGVHRDNFLREVFGSSLLEILVNAPCPVLTIRE